MKNVNITLSTTNGGGEFYPSNFIYSVEDNVSIEQIENLINNAKEELDDYYDEDIMEYLVEKLGGSYEVPPIFSPDIDMVI